MFDLQMSPPPLTTVDSEELLEAMAAAVQRAINQLTALQLTWAAEFGIRRPAPELPAVPGGECARPAGVSEFAAAEIACALTLSRRAADRLLGTRPGPATAAWHRGGFRRRRAGPPPGPADLR